jgi:hypothetical protein
VNYRPYPDVDRALNQVERGRLPEPPSPLLAWIDEAMAPLRLTDWQKAFVECWAEISLPKLNGRSTITAALADQAVKAGEHVHVAGRDGMRCAGGDDTCALPQAEPERCGFVHDQWLDGIYHERRRCTAPAGHSDGQFAYDHGPWETVPRTEPER